MAIFNVRRLRFGLMCNFAQDVSGMLVALTIVWIVRFQLMDNGMFNKINYWSKICCLVVTIPIFALSLNIGVQGLVLYGIMPLLVLCLIITVCGAIGVAYMLNKVVNDDR